MKLLLKHIAPYLPYELEMKSNVDQGELLGIDIDDHGEISLKLDCSNWYEKI